MPSWDRADFECAGPAALPASELGRVHMNLRPRLGRVIKRRSSKQPCRITSTSGNINTHPNPRGWDCLNSGGSDLHCLVCVIEVVRFVGVHSVSIGGGKPIRECELEDGAHGP